MSSRLYHKKDWWLSVRDSGLFNEATIRNGDYMYGVCIRYEFPATHDRLVKARQASRRKTIRPRLNEPLSKHLTSRLKWARSRLFNAYPFAPNRMRRKNPYFRPKKAKPPGSPSYSWGGRMPEGFNIKLRKTRGRKIPDYPFYRRVIEYNRSSRYFKRFGFPGG